MAPDGKAMVAENKLNRILWFAARPDAPYPGEFACTHGKGLKALHLKLDPDQSVDDDD